MDDKNDRPVIKLGILILISLLAYWVINLAVQNFNKNSSIKDGILDYVEFVGENMMEDPDSYQVNQINVAPKAEIVNEVISEPVSAPEPVTPAVSARPVLPVKVGWSTHKNQSNGFAIQVPPGYYALEKFGTTHIAPKPAFAGQETQSVMLIFVRGGSYDSGDIFGKIMNVERSAEFFVNGVKARNAYLVSLQNEEVRCDFVSVDKPSLSGSSSHYQITSLYCGQEKWPLFDEVLETFYVI